MLVDKSILVGGFGGQGVQTLGKLIIFAANEVDLEATFYPAYGGEMRGGTSNCTIVISDQKIGSPSRKKLDNVIAMNIPAYEKFKNSVKKDGNIFINSSLITEIDENTDINIINVPLNDLSQKIGSSKTINVIMLGFVSQYMKIMPIETVKATMLQKLGKKKEFIEINSKAFDLGVLTADEMIKAR
jgi:2-oxoglutarate ferredoxin oxidoreductase subunit gamma